MSKTISVIIPVKDRADSLLRAIESVKKQTYPVSEIVVVDDGSEKPVHVLLAEKQINVTCLRNDSAKGAPYSRNLGWKHATTELIAFLDSDDELEPTVLADKISLIETGSLDLVVGSVKLDDGASVRTITYRPDATLPLRDNLLNNNLFDARTSTIVVKKSVLEVVSFDEKLSKHQDWDLFINIDRRFKAGFTNNSDTIIHVSVSDRISSTLRHDATRYFIEKNRSLVAADSMFIFVVKMLFRAQRISDKAGEEIYKNVLKQDFAGISIRNSVIRFFLIKGIFSANMLHKVKQIFRR